MSTLAFTRSHLTLAQEKRHQETPLATFWSTELECETWEIKWINFKVEGL